LIDPVKRRRYDSSLPFNDTIPSEDNTAECTDEVFYTLFDPVFKRNSMFSKKSPLPRFGNGESTLEDALKFYKFWDNFSSWREFS
jgi:DnaJ family protein C protein 2